MTEAALQQEFEDIVRSILRSSDNLASAAELRQQVTIAWRAFQAADRDNSNTISIDEVQGLVDQMGLSISEDAETAMLELDTDLSGVIEPVEFMHWYCSIITSEVALDRNAELDFVYGLAVCIMCCIVERRWLERVSRNPNVEKQQQIIAVHRHNARLHLEICSWNDAAVYLMRLHRRIASNSLIGMGVGP